MVSNVLLHFWRTKCEDLLSCPKTCIANKVLAYKLFLRPVLLFEWFEINSTELQQLETRALENIFRTTIKSTLYTQYSDLDLTKYLNLIELRWQQSTGSQASNVRRFLHGSFRESGNPAPYFSRSLDLKMQRAHSRGDRTCPLQRWGVPQLNADQTSVETEQRVECARLWCRRHWQVLTDRFFNHTFKFQLYRFFVRPILTFGCEVWRLDQTSIDKLRDFECSVLFEIYISQYPARHPKRMNPNLRYVYKKYRDRDIIEYIYHERLNWRELLRSEEVAMEGKERRVRWWISSRIGSRNRLVDYGLSQCINMEVKRIMEGCEALKGLNVTTVGGTMVDDHNCDVFLPKQVFSEEPLFKYIMADSKKFYSIMVLDPDATPQMEGEFYLHMLKSNVPGLALKSKDSSKTMGIDFRGYKAPSPSRGTGTHHYLILLYEQGDGNNFLPTMTTTRSRFPLASWLRGKNLCGPVAGTQFRLQY